jgi:hypothetical protein
MMRRARVLPVVGVAVAAAALFVALVLRPWWNELAPEVAQLPLGLLSLGLGVAVALWLQRGPKLGGRKHIRRPRRLRNRVMQRSEQASGAEDD